MKLISKLNNTSKIMLLILVIVVYTAILLGLLTLGGSLKSVNKMYEEYSEIPGDENIDISIRIKERRTLPSSNKDKEIQYWDLQFYLHLKDQKAIYRNITIYTTVLKKDGTYKYEEKSASVITGIENPNNVSGSETDRGIFSSFSATSKTMVYDANNSNYIKSDGEPDKIYVKVVYEIRNEGEKNKTKSFTYKCDVLNSADVDFSEYELGAINNAQNIILKDIDDILKVKVRTTFEDSNDGSGVYRLNTTYNPIDSFGENVVKNASLALFLKSNNHKSDTENYFSDYIEFVQYHGALPYLYTIPQVPTTYMSEIEKLYVYAKINNKDGNTNEAKVYIPVESLPVF